MFKSACILLAVFSLLGVQRFARAEDAAPNALTLIGKGIENKSTQQMIAVACTRPTDSECTEIRLIEFTDQAPHWISKPYQISGIGA